MSLLRSIYKVFAANVVQLITGIVVTFFVPKAVSVENYSLIKTYTLYTGYVALFSMGFYDGIYLKYGGMCKESLQKKVINAEHFGFILLQLLWMSLWVIIGISIKNNVLLFFALTLFPANLFTFYKRVCLAIGEFDHYKNTMMVYSVMYMLLNCIFAIVLKINSPTPYYWCLILANSFAVLYNIIHFKFYFGLQFDLNLISKKIFSENIKLGILILFGNIAVSTIYSIGSWFVKVGYADSDFAYYSFAVSMLNVIMVLIQAVGLALFNYLAKEKDLKQIRNINSILLSIGTLVSSGYFVLYFIVTKFLPIYSPSLAIINISFITYPYMIVINSIYLNLYKTEKRDKGYIISVLFMISISCVLNFFAILSVKGIITVAMATSAAFIIWYIFCCRDFQFKYISNNELPYLTVMMISFLGLTLLNNIYLALCCYIVIWLLSTFMFLRNNGIKALSFIRL